MSFVVERFERDGWKVTVHCDESYPSPREEGDMQGLFLGFPHRHYNIGDETIDPDDIEKACPVCVDSPDDDCERCGGYGSVPIEGLADLIDHVSRRYDARLVMPVGMIDHSGVSYYLGGGPSPFDPGGWDSGTCGLYLFTVDQLKAWGHDNPWEIDDAELEKWMAGELAEYTAWCNGECYGFTIEDRDGEELCAEWGMIGRETLDSELDAAIKGAGLCPPATTWPDSEAMEAMSGDELLELAYRMRDEIARLNSKIGGR